MTEKIHFPYFIPNTGNGLDHFGHYGCVIVGNFSCQSEILLHTARPRHL